MDKTLLHGLRYRYTAEDYLVKQFVNCKFATVNDMATLRRVSYLNTALVEEGVNGTRT